MKNVQISFEEALLETVDQYAAEARLSRSALVRDAIRVWIHARKEAAFEAAWIEAAKRNSGADSNVDPNVDDDAWHEVSAQAWADE